MKKYNIVLLVILAVLNSSCSYKVIDFALLSSKNVDFSKGSSFVKGKSKVEGKDLAHIIILVPSKTIKINVALDKAIESKQGCVALLDGHIYQKFWFIPYIYGKQYFVVEGIPLIDPSLAFNVNKTSLYQKIELNQNGDIKLQENISSTEYYALKE
jgi:hypothetical protein